MPKTSIDPVMVKCEICGGMTPEGTLSGCEKCGYMFCPECNSVEPDTCVECV
jgi:hypothetical protein